MIPDATVRFSCSSGSFLNFSSKIRGQVGPGGWHEPCKVTNLTWDMRKNKEAEVHDQQNLEVLESLSFFGRAKKNKETKLTKTFLELHPCLPFFCISGESLSNPGIHSLSTLVLVKIGEHRAPSHVAFALYVTDESEISRCMYWCTRTQRLPFFHPALRRKSDNVSHGNGLISVQMRNNNWWNSLMFF